MSTRRMGWRRLGQVILGLALGAIGLVMWSSSSASALDATAGDPAPPTLADHLAGLVEQVTTPVDRALEPLGVGVAPVVEPLQDDVLAPTLDAIGSAALELTGPQPTSPADGGDGGLPDLPALPTPGTAGATRGDAPAATSLDAGPPPADAGVVPSPSSGGTRVDDGAAEPPSAVAHLSADPAPAEGGSSPGPALPAPVPLVQAVLGSLTSSGQGATGLVLLAVLAGIAAVLGTPPTRRLALPVGLALRAPATAVLTPPG